MTYHILPLHDIEPHEESTTCKCRPTVEILEDGEMMVVHNSFDKRGEMEKRMDRVLKNCN